jgi:hypothetical protein
MLLGRTPSDRNMNWGAARIFPREGIQTNNDKQTNKNIRKDLVVSRTFLFRPIALELQLCM